ncbi:hypothetical protein L208DRAFT_434948 [Tricholoma matsutake]|nr:hypothetical protein L208DRAFT_434948 [Tricholoma matsutake 945]
MCHSGAFHPFQGFVGFGKFCRWHRVPSRFGRCSRAFSTNSFALLGARAMCVTLVLGTFFVW